MGEDNSPLVEIRLRFKVRLQEAGPVDYYLTSMLEASAAKLLEWYFDYPVVHRLHEALEPRTYVDAEGGCSYTVQS